MLFNFINAELSLRKKTRVTIIELLNISIKSVTRQKQLHINNNCNPEFGQFIFRLKSL